MGPSKRNILITGSSTGGMGAALAVAFHHAGHRVFATARTPSKMSDLAAQGIETVILDVTSASSIASAVSTVSSSLPDGEGLDMLINNAAGSYSMPLTDVSLAAAKATFDLNVWSQLAVIQAFLPLLLQQQQFAASRTGPRPLVVNHTSVGSVGAIPFQGVYNASKAALAMISDTLRFELAPFGLGVVELKTAGVRTNIIANSNANAAGERLPDGSLYAPARDVVERALAQEGLVHIGISAEQWATEVSALLLRSHPPAVIWKGEKASLARLASILPRGWMDGFIMKMTKLDVVTEIIKESRK